MKRSTSLAWLLSILLILAGIAAQAHILERDLMPGKRIRTTWIDENRDTDELYRMYLGESPVMEMHEDGSHRIYVYGDGRLLATADFSGPNTAPELYYYLLDHLGSPIAILDDDGHTVWPSANPDGYQKYQPYGEFASDPGNAGFTIPSFTGKFADPGSGNHYFNARYHTSDTGTTKGPMQFSSPDPIYGNLSDPLSWNRYAYCRNNPVRYVDPDGKDVVPARIISGNELINQIYTIEQANPTFTAEQTLEAWNNLPFGERDFYLATPDADPEIMSSLRSIDIKHMMGAAELSEDWGYDAGVQGGYFNEWWWLLRGVSGSFFDLEDVPSNKLGAQFGEKISNDFALSTQLRLFLEESGVQMNEGSKLENHIRWIELVHPPGQQFYEKQ